MSIGSDGAASAAPGEGARAQLSESADAATPAANAGAAKASVDIGRVLDEGPFTRMQKFVVLLAALAIVFDGFDGQLIGFAIPLLMKDWGVERAAFGPVLAAGLIGMAVGMAGGGWLADRIGRRRVLAASCVMFGVVTVLIGFAPNLLTLTVLRFIAGLGIGSALPSASTMTAEYTPARSRTLAVTLTIVSFPLGGMLAGLFAGWVLPRYGWQGLFIIGGAMPALFGLLLFALLPESPRFLARHEPRWPDLVKLLARMGRQLPAGSRFSDEAGKVSAAAAAAAEAKRPGFAALFQGSLARESVLICIAFFAVVMALYSAFSWLPTMLASQDVPVAMAGQGLTAYNLGGVFGALCCALFITRFGSRWPMVVFASGAALSAWAMMGLDVKANIAVLIAGFAVHGFFVNAVQVSLYALCAHVYPTDIRATGTATALAFGRGGGVLSAFIGAAVITQGGPSGYLGLLGGSMAAAGLALLAVRRHIPRVAYGAGEVAPRALPSTH